MWIRIARQFPLGGNKTFLVYAGTGTDLIFNHGVELPGFASFPLLEEPGTRAILAGQMKALVDLTREMSIGCILDAPTWMANADRAAPLGYDADRLVEVNKDAVSLVEEVRQAAARDDVLVSACIGPRYDPYADIPAVTVEDAHQYYAAQMQSLKDTSVDLVTAYTFNRQVRLRDASSLPETQICRSSCLWLSKRTGVWRTGPKLWTELIRSTRQPNRRRCFLWSTALRGRRSRSGRRNRGVSPSCEFDFLAARANSVDFSANAQFWVSQRGGEYSRSCIPQQS